MRAVTSRRPTAVTGGVDLILSNAEEIRNATPAV